jgi:hypothetical protein
MGDVRQVVHLVLHVRDDVVPGVGDCHGGLPFGWAPLV